MLLFMVWWHKTQVLHERHKCDTSTVQTTQVQHECHMKNASVSVSVPVPVWHECYTNDMSATRVKSFDFDNNTSQNMFSHPYISSTVNERLQGEEQFHFKNYLLEMPHSHAKMRLKNAPERLNFVMAEAISKSYALNCSCKCPCTFPHGYTY